jgi:inhibitor of KinA
VTSEGAGFPRYRLVADHAVLVEFGEAISHDINDQVRRLDSALSAAPFAGFTEAIPAYASVLVDFDPIVTDHMAVQHAIDRLLAQNTETPSKGPTREVLVCYEDEFAPDLDQVVAATGLSREIVIAAHLAGEYSVFMCGFAPGYAYLAGVPDSIQLPRKPSPVRGVPAGSVIIAGPQCIVTTLTMPTGWWRIGRSPTPILGSDEKRPFLFDVGDGVKFTRIDRRTFDAATARA